MDKQSLILLVDQGLAEREICSRLNVSRGTLQYWRKKYGVQMHREAHGKIPIEGSSRKCSNCGETDEAKFYGRKRFLCSKCHNVDVIRHGKDIRLKAIQHLGGACSKCGYQRYCGALDIHHVDASRKDTNFRNMRGWSWPRVLLEIERCVLLCKNCHAELHGDFNGD